MTGESIPVAFCFDIEPDLHTFDPGDPPPWRGFELLIEIVPALRASLENAIGRPPHFNWAVRSDPQIALGYGSPSYVFKRYRSFFEQALESGDGVGIHPHAWRWDGRDIGWVSDHIDQAWINECLEMSVSCYVDEFGAVPPFHRFGARHMNTATMNRVRELGVKVDMSVEPGEPARESGPYMGGYLSGRLPDFGHACRIPYHPDAADFCRPAPGGDEDLWAIPLTAGRAPKRPAPLALRLRHGLRHPAGAGYRALGRAGSSLTRRIHPTAVQPEERTLLMWPDWLSASAFWEEAIRSAGRLSAPYLAFAIRSETVVDPRLRQKFEAAMDAVLHGCVGAPLAFVRPDEILTVTHATSRTYQL